MNHLTYFVYRYPSESKYSPVPNDAESGNIEDYGCQLSIYPAAVGDTYTAPYHCWVDGECKVEPRRWQVAEVTRYRSDPQAEVVFSKAILTFDGEPIKDESSGDYCNVLEIAVIPEKFKISWPAAPKFHKRIGDQLWEGNYQVNKIFRFTAPDKYGDNEVKVLWCIPTEATQPELVAVS